MERRSRPPSTPSRWIAILLAAAMALAALLAWQALAAGSSHRRAAESVLRDSARFAAREFLRRSRDEIDHYALFPVIYVLSANERASPGAPLPDPEDLARLSRRMTRGRLLAKTLFRVNLATGDVSASPGAPAEVVAWAREKLPLLFAERSSLQGELRAEPATIAGSFHEIVYGVSPDQEHICLAFDIDTTEIKPLFERALADPLLPGSAGGGSPPPVSLELRDAWGRVLLRQGDPFDPIYGVEERMTSLGEGILHGMTLKASIPAAAAEKLVLGGVPSSRLPFVLATLLLAAGLLAAAVVLVRRERALAAMRSDFVSAVSHELRTPLAQIRLFAETLLLDRTRNPEERRRSLAIIDQEARRLTHLVDNTLRFTRAEKGQVTLAVAPEDVVRIVRDSVEAFAPLAAARGVQVRMRAPANAVAPVDAAALRQILLNLLDNAVKYGPEGQEVVVGVEPGEDRVRLVVEDHGPGIPPPESGRIFEKFVRLERDRTAHSGGAGIGLAVVRELAQLHGGTARVEEGPGGGSRFLVELPAAASQSVISGAVADREA
jgi:nitrogen-specific signal transduction histidine kinase